MLNQQLFDAFSELSTPLIADACLRLGMTFCLAPPGIRPVSPGHRLAGRVLRCGTMAVWMSSWKPWGQPNRVTSWS